MLEKNIQRKILQYLKTLPCCHCFKVAQGAYSTAGISDIICCCDGKFVAIEVKNEKGRPTTLQTKFIETIIKCNGIAFIARSVDDVKNILKEVCNG